MASITPPGQPAHEFQYTPVDLTSQYAPPSVNTSAPQTLYTYNTEQQPTLITRPDGKTIQFSYDTAGRLSSATTPSGVTSYSYSSATGNLDSIAAPGGENISYAYDGRLLTAAAWSGPVSGSVGRTYDNNFRLTGQTVNDTNPIAFTYDNDGLLTKPAV